MEQLHNGFTISFGDHAFPLSTDSVLLSGFTRIGRNAKILDLGSGCGTLGLLLCAQDPACRVTGVELNPDAHTAALTNIQSNALQSRLESICADLRSILFFRWAGQLSPSAGKARRFLRYGRAFPQRRLGAEIRRRFLSGPPPRAAG